MSESISNWMNEIKEGVWTSFGTASKDIMSVWAVFIVSRMKTSKQSYPSQKPIAVLSGGLARAIQSSSIETGLQTESEIVYERTVNVPHGAISEYGKEEFITKKQMK